MHADRSESVADSPLGKHGCPLANKPEGASSSMPIPAHLTTIALSSDWTLGEKVGGYESTIRTQKKALNKDFMLYFLSIFIRLVRNNSDCLEIFH